MATSPAFRGAYRRRRCVIPATSFTEWTSPKGSKTADAISRADGGLLFIAGLWDRCVTDDGPAESYTMPMIDAVTGDDVAPFHNRQPVIRAALWLDLNINPAPVLSAMPPGTLIADPPALAAQAEGRTTLRAIVAALNERGGADGAGRGVARSDGAEFAGASASLTAPQPSKNRS